MFIHIRIVFGELWVPGNFGRQERKAGRVNDRRMVAGGEPFHWRSMA